MDAGTLDDLVRLAQAGDREAYGRIVVDLHADLAAFVALRVPTRDLLEEVVQEAFVAGFVNLAQYRPEGTFVSWLKGIARHRALRLLHERSRGGSATPIEVVETALARAAAASGVSPADPWRLPRLRACLERLGPEARRLVEARYVDGVPLADLAQQAGRTYAALANVMTRLRAQLRACVEGAT